MVLAILFAPSIAFGAGTFRVATYNVNNLFRRPAVMELEGFNPVTRVVLNDVATLNELLARDSYEGVEADILKLLTQHPEIKKIGIEGHTDDMPIKRLKSASSMTLLRITETSTRPHP